MKTRQLKARLLKLKTVADACTLAAELYPTKEDHNGTIAERFIAGWVNAMDMRDAKHPDVENESDFIHYCLYEIKNGGYL